MTYIVWIRMTTMVGERFEAIDEAMKYIAQISSYEWSSMKGFSLVRKRGRTGLFNVKILDYNYSKKELETFRFQEKQESISWYEGRC